MTGITSAARVETLASACPPCELPLQRHNSLLRRFAARWIDTSWRAIRPCDLRGECPQALAGTDHDGGLLIIEGAAIGMAGHTEMRARAMLVFSADVALAYIAREHKNLFWVAEESCLTPSHRRHPAAHTGRY